MKRPLDELDMAIIAVVQQNFPLKQHKLIETLNKEYGKLGKTLKGGFYQSKIAMRLYTLSEYVLHENGVLLPNLKAFYRGVLLSKYVGASAKDPMFLELMHDLSNPEVHRCLIQGMLKFMLPQESKKKKEAYQKPNQWRGVVDPRDTRRMLELFINMESKASEIQSFLKKENFDESTIKYVLNDLSLVGKLIRSSPLIELANFIIKTNDTIKK
jgi:hypothetical protein